MVVSRSRCSEMGKRSTTESLMVVETDNDKTLVLDEGEESSVLLSRGDDRDPLGGSSVVPGVRRTRRQTLSEATETMLVLWWLAEDDDGGREDLRGLLWLISSEAAPCLSEQDEDDDGVVGGGNDRQSSPAVSRKRRRRGPRGRSFSRGVLTMAAREGSSATIDWCGGHRRQLEDGRRRWRSPHENKEERRAEGFVEAMQQTNIRVFCSRFIKNCGCSTLV